MQAVIDYVMAHSAILLVVVYEIWSLIPTTVIASSSVLTFIGGFIRKPAQLP